MTDVRVDAAELGARFLTVHESQAVFRLLLESVSRPGTVLQFPSELVERIPAVEIPLLALLGYNTPFALIGADNSREVLISRVTSGVISSPENAAYVGVLDAHSPLLPLGLSLGTPMRPDFAAQVSVQMSGTFTPTATASTLTVSGPGVEFENHVSYNGGSIDELSFLARRNWKAPCGLDLWLVGSDGSFIGISRTSTVRIETTSESTSI